MQWLQQNKNEIIIAEFLCIQTSHIVHQDAAWAPKLYCDTSCTLIRSRIPGREASISCSITTRQADVSISITYGSSKIRCCRVHSMLGKLHLIWTHDGCNRTNERTICSNCICIRSRDDWKINFNYSAFINPFSMCARNVIRQCLICGRK